MPYKKTNRKKTRKTYRSGGGYLNTAAKALAVAYATKKLLNVEKKYVDFSLPSTTNIAYDAPVSQLLNGIGEGDAATGRDGNSVKMLYVTLNGELLQGGSSGNTSIRLMLVQKRDTNQTAPVIGDILENSASELSVHSYYNRDTIHNYQVLVDKKMTLTADGAGQIKNFQINHKFHGDRDGKIRFDGVGATVASIQKNAVYLIVTCDKAAASAYKPFMTLYSRCTYVDN